MPELIPPTKSLSEIENDLFSETAARTPFTNFNVGAGIRHLLEVIAKAIYDLHSLLALVTNQSWVSTATGTWLDQKVREVGIVRRPAVKAQIALTFRTSSPAGSDITVPIGTICKSRKDTQGNEYRFVTVETGTIAQGTDAATVLAEAEQSGSAWNVAVGSVSRMVTKINGIASASNESPLVREGADGESDDALRQRAILTWETLGLGGTRKAYQAWAMAVPGVRAVSILDDFPFGPGTVGVAILGDTGIPSASLLADVQTAIDASKPLTADVRVLAPEIIEQPLSLRVTHYVDTDIAALETEIRDAITGFNASLQLGEGLLRARVVQLLISLPGVYNVEVVSPASDQSLPPSQFLEITPVSITMQLKGRTYQDSLIQGGDGDLDSEGTTIPPVSRSRFTLLSEEES